MHRYLHTSQMPDCNGRKIQRLFFWEFVVVLIAEFYTSFIGICNFAYFNVFSHAFYVSRTIIDLLSFYLILFVFRLVLWAGRRLHYRLYCNQSMTHCFLFSFLDDVEHNLTYGI